MPVVSVAYSNRTFTPSRIHRPSTHLLDQQGRARSNRVRTKSQEKSKKQKAGATHPHRRLGSETVREVSICNFACTLLRFGESARLFSLLVSAYANDDETIGSPFCAYQTLRMEPAAFSRCRFPPGCAQLSEELSSSQSGNAGHVSVQLIGRIWNRNPVSDWLVQGLRGSEIVDAVQRAKTGATRPPLTVLPRERRLVHPSCTTGCTISGRSSDCFRTNRDRIQRERAAATT